MGAYTNSIPIGLINASVTFRCTAVYGPYPGQGGLEDLSPLSPWQCSIPQIPCLQGVGMSRSFGYRNGEDVSAANQWCREQELFGISVVLYVFYCHFLPVGQDVICIWTPECKDTFATFNYSTKERWISRLSICRSSCRETWAVCCYRYRRTVNE